MDKFRSAIGDDCTIVAYIQCVYVNLFSENSFNFNCVFLIVVINIINIYFMKVRKNVKNNI